jgi:DNA-binding GntR family transcriptional regulator
MWYARFVTVRSNAPQSPAESGVGSRILLAGSSPAFNSPTKEALIADFLREEIIAGRLPRGTRLKQAEVAAQLKTSITPVREAFQILKAERYLSGASHVGLVVTPFDAYASVEIRDLRILLEGQLIRRCVELIDSRTLAEVRALNYDLRNAVEQSDGTIARGLNYRFHQRLHQIASLPQTLEFVQILWSRYPFDLINRIPGRVNHAPDEHAELLMRIEDGDADGAVAANQAHIEAGWAALLDSQEQQG